MPEIRLNSNIRLAPLNYAVAQAGNGNAYLEIFQGSVPTTISESESRSSDSLWKNTEYNDISLISMDTNYDTATASGIATWFKIYTQDVDGWGPTSITIIGTVGTTNSSDLVMGNTTISSGSSYRISGMSFSLPEVISY